ncbi:hypothetical protein M422DRAFT_59674 [Sphaerobolus stellatus SS14]|uniref:arginine--tRNA ligase n=1 Tax=Sphaerobolus stellatus (strain SS14) TaxID=990650 RepID=A0A0C9UST6_SPHS4|nr:hypothetical protein M422DRAFT_59674 [Sphaerobolus stellatus SS14]
MHNLLIVKDADIDHVPLYLFILFNLSLDVVFAAIDLGKKTDFTLAVPRVRIKQDVKALISKIVEEFTTNEYVDGIVPDSPFIYFYCNTVILSRTVLDKFYISSRPAESGTTIPYGSNTSGTGKNIIVENSSPNIAKSFYAGHLRSTVIGAFISNLFQANGDLSSEIGLLAVGFKRFGSEEEFQKNAILHLFNIYVAINKEAETERSEAGEQVINTEARNFFRKMENGDEEVLALWKRFRDLSIKKYEETYGRLNVHFDIYAGESQVKPETIVKAMDILPREGPRPLALAIDLKKWHLDKPVVQKPDDTTIYIMRDIAGAIERYEKSKFDKIIYVVGDQQNLHIAQFFKILSLMELPFASTLEHVNFGRFLEDILDTAQEAMLEQMQKNETKIQEIRDPEYTADQVGMTCVKGDTGVYLQYAHTRLCSVERKVAQSVTITSHSEADTSLLVEPEARDIIYLLATFPNVVKASLKTYESSTIVTYCFKLSHAISSAWERLIVMGQEQKLVQAWLYLYIYARDVLATGMRLLSLAPLDRM